MPSLARKSMNFMRDVYNIAATPGAPPLPALPLQSQGFQSNQGLSSQFNQTNQYQQPPPPPPPPVYPLYAPPSPYLSPSSGPPQPQPQPHGSWNIPPTPISPPLTQPGFNFPPAHATAPNFAPGYGLPVSPPTSFSSPTTPQTYQQQLPQIELQYFPTQPPPLPQRPTQHGPSLSWQDSSETGWHDQFQLGGSVINANDHEPVSTQQFPFSPALDTQNAGSGAYPGPVEPQNSRLPAPPPLPPRFQTPKTDVVDDQAGNMSNMVPPPGSYYDSYNSTPNVLGPSPSIPSGYYEMPAESLADKSPARDHYTTNVWGLAELPAPMSVQPSASTNAPSPDTTWNIHVNSPANGAVELPASPIKNTSQHLRDRPKHERHISKTRPTEFSPEATDELDTMEFLHRDLGVALPPMTFNKSPRRTSIQQDQNKLPSPPPSVSTPSEYSHTSDSAREKAKNKLEAATLSYEPPRSRRTSSAALPYPEDNGPVMMPLHLDYASRQDVTARGLR